jgi:outer membrane protein OmpA-like peptidoglycan-associated protein
MATISLLSRAFVVTGLTIAATAVLTPALSSGAMAAEASPSVQQIIEALKPRKSRGLSVKPTPAEVARAKTIDDLKTKASSGGLSAEERNELADAANDKPSLDFVIYFDFNKATISKRSRPTLDALGTALQDDSLKNASIMVAGHTDAKGRAEYNQALSERRADAVREYLAQNFGVPETNLTVVGYGAERLKLKADPYASANRRVTIVNITDKTAANAK